jgi:hypothetical protein
MLVVGACEESQTERVPLPVAPAPAELAAEVVAGEEAEALVDSEDDEAEPASPEPAPLGFVGSELTQQEIVEQLTDGDVRRIRPIRASQSIVFRIRMRGSVDAAYKPRTQQLRWGYRAEVAAYRVALALGMDNVPPAAVRYYRRSVMERQVDSDFADRWSDFSDMMRWEPGGSVPGAMIYWIPELQDTELDRRSRMEEWSGWLRHDGEVPEGKETLARDLATMVAFDFLIANWDRFSGGNVDGNAEQTRLYVRDHNVAFAHPLPERLQRRMSAHLRRTERFSRVWIEALRAMDEPAWRAAMRESDDEESPTLLGENQLQDLQGRQRALLSYVGALVDSHGEAATLYFP